MGTSTFTKARSGSVKATDIEPERNASPGDAAWFRVMSPRGDVLWDGEVGPLGSGAACELDHLDIQSGAEVSIRSLVYTLPE